MSDSTSSSPVVVVSSEDLRIGPLRLSWLMDLVFVSVLALVFCTLHRSTPTRPYHEEDLRAAHSAHLLVQNHLKPVVSGFRNGVLVQELYATGWLVLGHDYEWWPHVVALVLAFLAILYTYRLLGGGAWGSTVGFLCASLIAVDPLFLAESNGISVVAPSIGLATAALYYFVRDKPKRFAIVGSLTALCYLPTVFVLICLIALALIRQLVRMKWQYPVNEVAYGGLVNQGRNWGVAVCFLIPGIVFAVWVLLWPWSQGYSIFDPMFWAGDRTAGLPQQQFGISLREVFLRHGHVVFTVVTAFGMVAFWVLMLRVLLADFWSKDQAQRCFLWFAATGELPLLSVLLVSIAAFAAVMPVSGAVPEGRQLLVLLVPLFALTCLYLGSILCAAEGRLRWQYKVRGSTLSPVEYAWVITFSMLLGWNLGALRYAAVVMIISVVFAASSEMSVRWARHQAVGRLDAKSN